MIKKILLLICFMLLFVGCSSNDPGIPVKPSTSDGVQNEGVGNPDSSVGGAISQASLASEISGEPRLQLGYSNIRSNYNFSEPIIMNASFNHSKMTKVINFSITDSGLVWNKAYVLDVDNVNNWTGYSIFVDSDNNHFKEVDLSGVEFSNGWLNSKNGISVNYYINTFGVNENVSNDGDYVFYFMSCNKKFSGWDCWAPGTREPNVWSIVGFTVKRNLVDINLVAGADEGNWANEAVFYINYSFPTLPTDERRWLTYALRDYNGGAFLNYFINNLSITYPSGNSVIVPYERLISLLGYSSYSEIILPNNSSDILGLDKCVEPGYCSLKISGYFNEIEDVNLSFVATLVGVQKWNSTGLINQTITANPGVVSQIGILSLCKKVNNGISSTFDIDGDGYVCVDTDEKILYNYQFAGGKNTGDVLQGISLPDSARLTNNHLLINYIENHLCSFDLDDSDGGSFYNLIDLRLLDNYLYGKPIVSSNPSANRVDSQEIIDYLNNPIC